ncbi:TraX family protein [Phytopseudomonas daroniae]|uniref:TraX family protein n=1 Tax=Phytopseudomonas daroniae TaxID=2487519 RepID=UPI0010385815|nr:TraX family protein [Pseudomonas daroniae]TBU77179.1 hypothetical protein DNK10_06630 [Pseudomonas daroniae]
MRRDSSLDLLKWMAIALMTLGHTRFVWPEMSWASYPGRFAFVALCAVMAAHTMRQGDPSRSTWRQLGLLAVAATVSQWPYHALTDRDMGNIMITLACGIAVMTGLRIPDWHGVLLATVGIATPLVLPIEYGLLGVLLPSGFLIALSGSQRRWLLPISLAALCQGGSIWQSILAALSSLSVLVFLSAAWKLPHLPRVGRWTYVYYPAHMMIFVLIANMMNLHG